MDTTSASITCIWGARLRAIINKDFTPNTWVKIWSILRTSLISTLIYIQHYPTYHCILHLGPTNSNKVLTGYEPRAYLTLPSTSVQTSLLQRIVLQIYPNCLLQSPTLGNLQFPYPIGSYTSSISKKVYWSHFTLQPRHTEQQKNSIASLLESSSDKDQRGLYLLIRLKNRELYWGTSCPIYIIR